MSYIDLSTQELQRLLSLFPSSRSSTDHILYDKLLKLLEKDMGKSKYEFISEHYADQQLSQIYSLPEDQIDVDIGVFLGQYKGKVYLTAIKYLKRNKYILMRDLMEMTVSKLKTFVISGLSEEQLFS